MLLASLLTVASVLLGALLGLVGRGERALGRLRALALGAALAVVGAQLLPEAAVRLGPIALLATALGFAMPTAFERLELGRRLRAEGVEHGRVGLELGFVGLLVHQVGDGLGMGAFTGPGHHDHVHLEVFLTVAAHTVPIVAVVAAAFARVAGVAVAIVRSALLAAASLAGVVLAGSTFASTLAPHHAWVSAIVGGLLLHVVVHGLDESAQPSLARRGLDLSLVAAGAAAVLASLSDHGHDGAPPIVGEVVAALERHATLVAVPLLAALALGFVVELSSRGPTGASRRSPVEGAVVAALLLGPAWGAAVALGWAAGGLRSARALALDDADEARDATTVSVGARLAPLFERATRVLPGVVFALALTIALDLAAMDAPFDRVGSLVVALGLGLVGGRSVVAAVPLALVALHRGAEVPMLVGGLAAGPALASLGHALRARHCREATEALAWALGAAAACFALAVALTVRWSPLVASPLVGHRAALVALAAAFAGGALYRGVSALVPAWAVHHHPEHGDHEHDGASHRAPPTAAVDDAAER